MPGERTRCEVCTKQFRRAPGSDLRRCASCRSGMTVTPLSQPSPEPPRRERPQAPSVHAATLEALTAAGRESSPLGVVTLKLALELDAAEGVAAQRIADGHRKSLEAALVDAEPPADALDQLRKRREAKAASA